MSLRFLNDGYNVARSAIEPEIRAQVAAQFAAQWKVAGPWRRIWIWRQMKAEIERRVSKLAKPDAFY